MKKSLWWLLVVLLSVSMIATFSLAGCKEEEAAPAEEVAEEAPAEEVAEEEVELGPEVETAVELGEIKTRGPEGQVPVWYTELTLTEEEKTKIEAGNYSIAYDQGVVALFDDTIGKAIEHRSNELGIEPAAWTINNLDAGVQRENIETILAMNPSAIAALSVDPVVSREIFKDAADRGVKLVFCSNKPADFEWNKDYQGALIIFDFYEFGDLLAGPLNSALGGEGKIGYLYHDADFFITNQRDQGFKDAIKNYPGLEIVVEMGWSGFFGDVEDIISAMITQHPEINGIYLPWTEAVMPAISALRAADRMDVKIVANDIGEDVALEMIKGDQIVALNQCMAWQYGVTAVDIAVYALLNKEIPAECILIPGIGITKDNIEEAWPLLFNEELPEVLKDALQG